MVPATGVFWSTFWSTVLTGACATPPPRDAVYSPDLRLGFDNCQVDGFEYLGG